MISKYTISKYNIVCKLYITHWNSIANPNNSPIAKKGLESETNWSGVYAWLQTTVKFQLDVLLALSRRLQIITKNHQKWMVELPTFFLLLPPLVSKSQRNRIISCDWLDKRNYSFFTQLPVIQKSCQDLFKTWPEQLWRHSQALAVWAGQLESALWLSLLWEAGSPKVRAEESSAV